MEGVDLHICKDPSVLNEKLWSHFQGSGFFLYHLAKNKTLQYDTRYQLPAMQSRDPSPCASTPTHTPLHVTSIGHNVSHSGLPLIPGDDLRP